MTALELRVLALEKLVEEQLKIISYLNDRFYETQLDIQNIDRLNDTFLKIHEQNINNTEMICAKLERIAPQVDNLWQDFQIRQVRKQTDMLN